MNRLPRSLYIGLPFVVLASLAFGSYIVEMSFEQAAQTADVIVLGTVVEVSTMGREEQGVVVRDNRVRVDEYLKGEGESEIVVQTIGGPFMQEKDGHVERMTAVVPGQPQLPSVGTRVLLFLTRYGGSGAYMICSASHGVREVMRRPGSTEGSVVLAFQRPDLMPRRAADDYRRAHAAGPVGPNEFFHDDVPISALKDLVRQTIAPVPRPKPDAAAPSGR